MTKTTIFIITTTTVIVIYEIIGIYNPLLLIGSLICIYTIVGLITYLKRRNHDKGKTPD